MIIALTPRQWRALGRATGLGDALAAIGPRCSEVDLDTEAGRFAARDAIAAWSGRGARPDADRDRAAFAGSGVLWGPFQDFATLVDDDPRCSTANPLFAEIEQPGIGRYLDARPAARFCCGAARADPPGAAPRRAHRSRAGEVLGLSPPRSAGCTTPASSPDSPSTNRSAGVSPGFGAAGTAALPVYQDCSASRSFCSRRICRNRSRTLRAVRSLRPISGARRKSPSPSSQPASVSGGSSRMTSAKARKIAST
jgi:hypothetical protein